MQEPTRLENGTHSGDSNLEQDNTVTFLIGFGILVLFVIAGIMASIFLCITLKKDPYLWEPQAAEDNKKRASEEGARCSTMSAAECHTAADAIL